MTKSGFIEDMILLIRQAESEALKNNIQANTVILNNKKFGKVKPFLYRPRGFTANDMWVRNKSIKRIAGRL